MMHTLIVDLNNFSRYPTLSVGYLVAILRNNNVKVDVLSPFAKGVVGYPRLTRARKRDLYYSYLKHWLAVTPNTLLKKIRAIVKKAFQPGGTDDKEVILNYFQELLENNPDVVLISAYTMYFDICHEISKICNQRNIPVIVGGSAFVEPQIAKLWDSIPGVSVVYLGEPEFHLMKIIEDLVDGKDVSQYSGVYVEQTEVNLPAAPISPLDMLPFPDFSDFPWVSYPNRVIPIMTGRGCEWDICTFCSDVVTASGRSFRSRSIENIMTEIKSHKAKFNATLFVFLDLKLNSDLYVWRELIFRIPHVIPDAQWTASIHVDNRIDNGLSREDLYRAHAAGLVRITCGLESGSPRILKLMAKGIKLKRLSTFLKNAHEAGVSVRMTTIIGYPHEEPEDVDLTTQFIEEHSKYIERIVLNRFTLMPNTPIERILKSQPQDFPFIKTNGLDLHSAIIPHVNQKLATKDYYIAVFRLIRAIHKINQHPLKESAQEFEGVM